MTTGSFDPGMAAMVGVGGMGVSVGVAVGGMGVSVGMAVGGIGAFVEVGGMAGVDDFPDPQPEIAKIMTRIRIGKAICFVFMVSCDYHGRTRRLLKRVA